MDQSDIGLGLGMLDFAGDYSLFDVGDNKKKKGGKRGQWINNVKRDFRI